VERTNVPEKLGYDILWVRRHLGGRLQKHTTKSCHLKLQAPKDLVTRVCQGKQDHCSYRQSGRRGASDSVRPILAAVMDGWC
jgi:hypothetical protein